MRLVRASSIDAPTLAMSSSGHNATKLSSSRSIIAVKRCVGFMIRVYISSTGSAPAKAGFAVIRIKGSHHFLRNEDGRATVVPAHSGETIGLGLLHKILRDCHLRTEDLRRLVAN